ncbi:MAG: hypothetical protein ACLFO2_02690 [Candidatus Woesearchaeota archaeon]
MVNGKEAPNYYLVEAVIEGRVDGMAYSATYQAFTKDGSYGYDEIFYIEDPKNKRSGDEITFYVGPDSDNLVEADTHIFANFNSTELDLVVTGVDIGIDDNDDGGSSGGGSSGSSSGGGFVGTTTVDDEDNETDTGSSDDEDEIVVETVEECTPDWTCTSWGECVNAYETRRCVDKNECGIEEDKPEERRSCEVTIEELYQGGPDQQMGFFNRITGAVTGGGAGGWTLLVGVLLVLGGAFGFVWSRRKRS